MRLSAILLMLLIFPNSVYSYDRGDKLLWACESELDSLEGAMAKTYCIGYLSGVLDGIQLLFGFKPEVKFFCPPEFGTSGDQLLKVVVKYLKEHPEELHESGRSLVVTAYAVAFPCI